MCSLAPNIETLIGARFLQAVGGSMMNPVAMSIITQVFTGRVERARAIGVWGGVVGISMAARPDRRRRADRVRQLARGVLDQPADLRAGDRVDRDLRAGVQVRHHAQRRSDRAGSGHGLPVRHRLRAHRGPGSGLDRRAHRRGGDRRGRSPSSRFLRLRVAPPRPVHRPAVLPQHPVRVGDHDRGVRVRRVGCVPVHDVAVPAGRARLLRHAHRARSTCR